MSDKPTKGQMLALEMIADCNAKGYGFGWTYDCGVALKTWRWAHQSPYVTKGFINDAGRALLSRIEDNPNG